MHIFITVCFALIIVGLHTLSHVLKGTVPIIINAVNMALHIGLIFWLMHLDLQLSYVVLSFLVSLFAYLLTGYVTFKCKERREHDDI